jgi:phosphoribosyl 1,2-cyclic phosphate phosphodiesterase
MRASILLEEDGRNLLIDTSQDFYQQMAANRVKRIDGVLFTHGHADHIYGLPDIRSYCRRQGEPIDVYGSQESLDILHRTFAYIFEPPAFVGGGIPRLCAHLIDAQKTVRGFSVTPIPLRHGPLCGCQGYRIGDVAYLPDVKVIPEESLALLQGLDLLILNCLRIRPHASHLSLAESVAYAEQLAPRRCLFTHMTHDIDYELESRGLPDWMSFAYDGQVVDLAT